MKSKGLTGQLKQKLIEKSLQRKLKQHTQGDASSGIGIFSKVPSQEQQLATDFAQHNAYKQIKLMREASEALGLSDPFFKAHEGLAGATTRINGRELINFSSYNYLNLSGDPRVNQAIQEAVEQYGSSVSASRMVSGERPIHQQLEKALADHYQVDDAVVFVSGHATNVTVIGFLMQPGDLILHDEWVHNSALMGAQMSTAKRIAFRHNDMVHLEDLLEQYRSQFKRVLILSEGLFSMDGDWPNLHSLVELKNRYHAWLMIDEAHSLGVLGSRGYGLAEQFGLSPNAVDIWMGTLSKSLAGCGGYIAGASPLVEMLRCLCPGFLYSVGMPAAMAAASLTALDIMHAEPERAQQLAANAQLFKQALDHAGFDTGQSQGRGLVPLITGSSVKATRLAAALFERDINVQPIVYPAVPEKQARLRFFISSAHTETQLLKTVNELKQILPRLA